VRVTTHRQTLQALSGLLMALFVSTLSTTVVTTALPSIIGSLQGSQTAATWVVTATLLTTTASTPIWGKLADLFSKKLLVQSATVVFVAGSVVAGLSQGVGVLIAGRAVQGIGAGGLQALVQISIGAMISPRERGRYAGYQSSATAIATIGGPLLGGLIVDTSWLGWRWCFWLSLPIAVIALAILQFTLNLPVIRRDRVRIDWAGATLISGGVSVLLIWISFVDSAFAWASWRTLILVTAGAAMLAVALLVETRVLEPIVPLHILGRRPVALAILGSLAAGTAMYGASVFLSQYFQTSRGHTPTESGLLTIPMMAGILLASLIGGWLLSRTGSIKPFLLVGTTALAAGFFGLSRIDHATPIPLVSLAMVFVGAGVGLTAQNFVLLVQNSVPLKDIGAATSTVSFFRALGGTIGVAVLGAVLARQVSSQASANLSAAGLPTTSAGRAVSAIHSPATAGPVRAILQATFGDVIGHIFLISAIVAVLGVLAVLALKPVSLRTSLDLPDPLRATAQGAEAVDGAAVVEELGTLGYQEERGAPSSGR
jgi:EmrB/QacA subfamily drug resistance transporter